MTTGYIGPSIVQDTGRDLLFVIPTKKSGWSILYTSLWLLLWLIGEISALSRLGDEPVGLLWFLAWTTGGVFVIRSLAWTLFGKELIAIDGAKLVIAHKGLLFSKPKAYDSAGIQDMRVQMNNGGIVGQFVIRKDHLNAGSNGIIRFGYGKEIVRFGGGISRSDATAIIQRMINDGYLQTQQIDPAILAEDPCRLQ